MPVENKTNQMLFFQWFFHTKPRSLESYNNRFSCKQKISAITKEMPGTILQFLGTIFEGRITWISVLSKENYMG